MRLSRHRSRSRPRRHIPEELSEYPLFDDYETALAELEPDAVSINTWPNTHADFAIKAMDAGAHVFMEKPIGTTNAEAEAVVAKARETDRKLVLGYILRVHPSWIKFVELGKTLGKPLVMRLNLNQQSSGDAWMWHKNLIDSLIPIVDCGVHYVDVMCQLTGAKPVRVHGIGASLWGEAAKQNYGQPDQRPPRRAELHLLRSAQDDRSGTGECRGRMETLKRRATASSASGAGDTRHGGSG